MGQRSRLMVGVSDLLPGCDLRPIGESGWVCTDHVPWGDGDFIHVAGAADAICAVRLDSDRSIYIEMASRPGMMPRTVKSWAEALKLIEADGRFFTPPTDEEIEAARQGALQLLQRMEAS